MTWTRTGRLLGDVKVCALPNVSVMCFAPPPGASKSSQGTFITSSLTDRNMARGSFPTRLLHKGALQH